ncbi:MAG TPA: cyclic peptide export ABC transporter [Steroidobacter sp.]|uniref:cyclic peptide export ABC transporter n=1 Tax=Steroidobacter sp. TaxID=1978227 RepID=UPI002ED91A58
MKLFSILAKHAPNKVFFAIVAGALSGVAYALLIPLVMYSLPSEDGSFKVLPSEPRYFFNLEVSNPTMALVFAIAVLFIWLSRTWSEVTLTRVSIGMASDLRVQMYHRIAHAPLTAIERIGLPRLSTAIAFDVPKVVLGAQYMPSVLMDAVTLSGMLLFLAYLNVDVFWFVLKCIGFGVLTTDAIYRLSDRYHARAAEINDSLQESIHGLIEGFKELKLSDEKRAKYFQNVLLAHETAFSKTQKTGCSVDAGATHYGQILSFLVIGAVIFIFVSYHPVTNENLVGIVMTLLYIATPIGSLLRTLPSVKISRIALKRVMELLAELPEENIAKDSVPSPAWERLRLEQVSYRHQPKGEATAFAVGPIDIEIRKGAITLIVGGNGSGKSTLGKLLTLHYHHCGGDIYFDDERISRDNINSYRQRIAAIYSDYYLFDRILTANWEEDTVRHYLRLFGLEEKVTYQNGMFSTLSLSDGQRRRMALVAAFVEDKDFYLFDEWAADQDPAFKQVFYRQILPSLRARGKAVVAITHDDRFFDVADTLIVMEEGKVSSIEHSRREPSRGPVVISLKE